MSSDLLPGDNAVLRVAPARGPLRAFVRRRCQILRTDTDGNIPVADVRFCDEGGALLLEHKDLPLSYLEPARDGKPQRRSPLNLHAPKDERSEKEKQAEAESWLASLSYGVLGVGQFRSAAVCWHCTREKRALTPPGVTVPAVKVFCPVHHKPVYSPDTGNSEGVADSLVRHPARWPSLSVLAVEWKRGRHAHRREKQLELAAAGWSVIVDSRRELAVAILAFEVEVLRIEPHPEIARWLEQHQGGGGVAK